MKTPVFFLSYYYKPNIGGIETYISTVSSQLSDDFEPIVISSDILRGSLSPLPLAPSLDCVPHYRIQTSGCNSFFSLFKIDRLLFSFRARALISKIRRRRSAVVICRDQYSAAAFIGFSNCTCLYLPPCVSFEEALLNVHFSLRRVSPFNALRQIIYLLTSSLPSYLLQSLSVFASSELIFSSSIFKLRFCFFFPFSFL